MTPPLDVDAAIALLMSDEMQTPHQNCKPNHRAKGRQNEAAIADWVYRWGYTSSMLLQHVIRRSAGGAAAHYCSKGLIKETKTASGVPAKFYTLARRGLELAEYNARERLPYPEFEPYRVNQNQMRHDLLVQALTLEQIHANSIAECITPKQFRNTINLPRHRRPNALWIERSGRRCALEVELSGKWERALDQFFTDAWDAIDAGLYDRVHVVSDSAALLERYRQHIRPGGSVRIWKRNQAGKWWPVDEVRVTQQLAGLFTWRVLASTAELQFATSRTRRPASATQVPTPTPAPPPVRSAPPPRRF